VRDFQKFEVGSEKGREEVRREERGRSALDHGEYIQK